MVLIGKEEGLDLGLGVRRKWEIYGVQSCMNSNTRKRRGKENNETTMP